MKKLILATVLSVASVAAVADSRSELCGAIAGYAEGVMIAHQNGVPLATSLSTTEGEMAESPLLDFYKAIVLEAYGKPRFLVQENKDRASDDFRDKIHLLCLKSIAK